MCKQRYLYYLLLLLLFVSAAPRPSHKDCTFRGQKLFGDVKVVTSNATFKIKVVTFSTHLRVRKVTYRPSECGEWRFVDFGEDFTVQFVDFGEDFTIEYVNYNPGVKPF